MMQRNLPKMWCMFRGFVCLLNLIALALSWLLKLASSITTQNNLFFRGVWLSFPYILKIACMTSTHWPDQHFHLLSFFAHPNNEQVQSDQTKTFVGPGLQVYGMVTPLFLICNNLLCWKINDLIGNTQRKQCWHLCDNGELFLWVKSRQ